MGGLIALLVAATLFVVLGRNSAASDSAQLTVFTGTVQVVHAGSTAATSAHTGDQLKQGDVVQALANTEAMVKFADGSITRLDQNTSIILSTLTRTTNGSIDVGITQTLGKTWSNVKAVVGNGGQFQVKGPNQSTAEVRGTTFEVIVEQQPDGTVVVRFDLFGGSLNVASANGGVLLGANQSTTVGPNQTPTPAGPIPAADLTSSFTVLNRGLDSVSGSVTQVTPGALTAVTSTAAVASPSGDGSQDGNYTLNWPGSIFGIVVHCADGDHSAKSSTPPVTVVVPQQKGTCTYTVTDYQSAPNEAYWVIVSFTPPTAVASPSPSASPSASPSPTPSPSPSSSPTAVPSASPSVAASPAAVTATPTPSPSASASPTPTVSPSASPTPTPTPPTAAGSPPAGTVGGRYAYKFTAAGGTSPYTFSVGSGSLPPGLTLDGNGLLRGTPTGPAGATPAVRSAQPASASSAPSTYAFTVVAKDAKGLASPGISATVTINPQPAVILSYPALSPSPSATPTPTPAPTPTPTPPPGLAPSPAAPPNGFAMEAPMGEIGLPYSQAFAVIGGMAPYTWSVSGNAAALSTLGLQLSAAGVLSGTPTTTVTNSLFAVRVTDANGAIADGQISIIIIAAPTYTPANNYVFSAAGTVEADSNTFFSGGLGFQSYDPSGQGQMSGIPAPLSNCLSASGAYLEGQLKYDNSCAGTYQFSLTFTDSLGGTVSSGPLTVIVNAVYALNGIPTTVDVSAPSSTWGVTMSGGHPGTTWSVYMSGLPPGMTCGAGCATATGTPTAPGVYQVAVYATDSSLSSNGSLYFGYTVTVTDNTPVISVAAVGTTVDDGQTPAGTFNVDGGAAPYSWSLSGSPTGLGLAGASTPSATYAGPVTGAPGAYNMTLQVCDKNNSCSNRLVEPLTVYAAPTLGTSAPTNSLTATSGTPFNGPAFNGTSGTSCLTLDVFPMPAGLSIAPQAQICSSAFAWTLGGTPTQPGSYTFHVRASDDNFIPTSQLTFTLVVSAPATPALTATVNTYPMATATAPGHWLYRVYTASGGATLDASAPGTATHQAGSLYDWAVTAGTLPPGATLSYNSQTATVSGTISAGATPGPYQFTLTVSGDQGTTGTVTDTITVYAYEPTPAAYAPNGDLGLAYAPFQFTMNGGTAPFTFSVGNVCDCSQTGIPSGLTLSTSGLMSGTPTAAGVSTLVIRVVDARGFVSTWVQGIAIAADLPTVTGMPALTGTTGATYSDSFLAGGGTPPYHWSLASGTLPSGLTFDAAGHLIGTPTAAGASTFTVQVTDAAGGTATSSVTITVAAGASPAARAGVPSPVPTVTLGPSPIPSPSARPAAASAPPASALHTASPVAPSPAPSPSPAPTPKPDLPPTPAPAPAPAPTPVATAPPAAAPKPATPNPAPTAASGPRTA